MPENIFQQFSQNRILVVGDMMLDHYLWGDVHRISPEAPVPVVNASHDTYTAGGAANVALNLAGLGVKVSALGYIGDDEAGKKLSGVLQQNQIRVIGNGNGDTPTIIKTRVIVRNQQLCRIDRELSRDQYRIEDAADFEQVLDEELAKVNAVLISDYAKGVITQTLVDLILTKARKYPGLLIAFDPKPARFISFKGVSLLTPNRNEALELAQLGPLQPGEKYPLDEICRKIHEIYAPKLLVITLGAEGMALCSEGKVLKLLPTEAREVFDVSGAGDTVIATLTAAITAGMGAEQAVWLANGAAGCVVAHMGTVPVDLAELEQWLASHSAVWNAYSASNKKAGE